MSPHKIDLGKDCVIEVAPLDFDQVELIQDMEVADGDNKAVRERAWKQVEMAAQNANPHATRDQIKKKLNAAFPGFTAHQKFGELHIAILKISGFEVKQSTGE